MRRLLYVSAIITLVPTLALAATGWGIIFKNGPFEEFRDGDWDMFQQTVVAAADHAPDGQVVEWSNAKTGAHGMVKVVERFESRDFGPCRKLSGRTDAEGRTAPFAITLCQRPGETWKMAVDPVRR
jgi:surface antigen